MASITHKEWQLMSCKRKTLWLENNRPASAASLGGRRLVRGVGVNDSTYCVQPEIDGVKVMCPAYDAWKSILSRCYDKNRHEKQPTYAGIKLSDDWRSFMSFRRWWIKNQVDGWQIDKDIIGDGIEYSPNSCVFIPQSLNKFTVGSEAIRGKWPIGVHFRVDLGKFQATCGNPISGRRENLGFFSCPDEAHNAWLERKLQLALELKSQMDCIDMRIYPRIVDIIMSKK